MIFLRSLIFNIYFFSITIFFSLIGLVCLILPYQALLKMTSWWSSMTRIGLRVISNVKVEIEDKGNIRDLNESYIVASKHQSALETILFYNIFKNSIFILKKELSYIPIFGLLVKKLHISVDRGNKKAMDSILKQLPKAIKQKRKIIIFPEGTRTKAGLKKEKIKYKSGIYYIAKSNPDLKIIPVSLNTGNVWGRKAFIKKSGVVNIKIHKPFKVSNLGNKKLFQEELRDIIEHN